MKYLKNTSWLFAEKILRMTLGLFVGIWVARYLGPEQFGLFSYAQSFVALFAAFATLGLDGIVIRELIKDESQRDKLLGTAFTLKLMGGIAVLLFLAIAMFFQSSDSLTTIFIFIIASATIFQSFNVIDFYFQSKVLSKYVVYSNVLSLLISSIIKVVLILNEAPLIAFAWVVLFDSFILAIGFIYFYLKNELSFRMWRFNKEQAVTLLKDSWPLILSGVAISIALRIDQVMIGHYLGVTSVGYYSAGVRLAEVAVFIPMMISQSLFPKIINMDFKLELNKLVLMIRFVFYMLVFMAVTVNIIASNVVEILYGAEYMDSYPVLNILIWTIAWTYLGVISNQLILKENNQKIILIKQVSLTLINVVLNIMLIPLYGIVGAALATLIVDALINLLFDVCFKKTRWLFYLKLEALFFIKRSVV